MLLAVEDFLYRNATVLGNLCGRTHFAESGDSSLNEVVGVRGTLRLGQHVGDTYALEHGTHSAAGLNTGTFGSGTQEDAAAAELGCLLVRYGTAVNGYADKVLLSGLDTLGDGSLNFVRLAKAPADDAVFIAYHYDGGKAEGTATLGYFGNAVDGYQTVLQIKIVSRFNSVISFCHDV